jgi:hypothetical protein
MAYQATGRKDRRHRKVEFRGSVKEKSTSR